MYDLGIINGKAYIEDKFIKTNIYIKDGLIKEITNKLLDSKETYDCNNNLVIPGIIDPHTHFDLNLGFTTSKDNFYTGSKAGAFGGVTTIIDFLDPVDNKSNLDKAFNKRKAQAKNSVIDYKFHACLKNPKNNIPSLIKGFKKNGLNTIKVFTTYSDSGRRTYDEEIKELLLHSKENNYTVTVHIEKDDLIITNNYDSYRKLPKNRPSKSETLEALKLAQMVKESDGLLYMVHLSSGKTLKALKNQYPDILNTRFFIESCPHYFTFTKKNLKEKNGFLFTMAPPLRSKKERQLLINHINDVYTIGTDHCVFNSNEKDKPLLKDIALGIGGVEESFRIMFSKFGETIIPKMTSNVAKAHYLYPQKGVIKIGSDADMFIYNLKDTMIYEYHSSCDYNLYFGEKVNGEIITTISRGEFVIKNKEYIEHTGKLLNKEGGSDESN